MKILNIVISYPPKRFIGAELYDHALNVHLQKAGHTVHVATGENLEQSWEYEGIQVNPPERPTTKYDLILTHVDYRQKAHYIRRLMNQTSIPIIGIQHNDTRNTIDDEQLYKWDGLIYNNYHMLNQSRNTTPNKTVLIPPCPAPAQDISKGTYILIVGTSLPKGIDTFYSIVQAMPDQQFMAVEGGWGKQEPKSYPNLKLIPHTNNLTPILKEAHILLLPSKYESWAMIASEALAEGKKVVTFDDLPGVKENIGDAGEYVPRGAKTNEWVKAIQKRKKTSKIREQADANYALHQKTLKDAEKMLQNIYQNANKSIEKR